MRGRKTRSKRCRLVAINPCAASLRSTGFRTMQQSVRNTPAPQPRCTVKCTFTLAPSLIFSIKAKIRGEEPPTELPADYALSSEETPQDRLRSKFGDEGLGSQVGFLRFGSRQGFGSTPSTAPTASNSSNSSNFDFGLPENMTKALGEYRRTAEPLL